MSITRLKRNYGLIVRCNHKNCTAKIQTANVFVDSNRSYASTQGWGRGLTKGNKRGVDLCPEHFKIEQALFAKQKAEREVEKARRDELKKAKFAGTLPKKPKKPRDSRATSSSPASSPSADSAPAAAT